mmetsp:Transcript_7988/g.24020  ORF Transcript_7988/g.24020 Transcript_7988/m.24020 type:complete len:260 (-) Transcript_7988:418-1197(-)
MASGRTSGTPPTRVVTTSRPQAAASRMAMQKASVSDTLRNTCPRRRTPRTSRGRTCPSISTRSWSWWRSRICSRATRIGPSPPIMKRTWSSRRHTSGMTSTSRSTPLRYTSRVTHTTTTPCPTRPAGSGVKTAVSTALGMTDTRAGSSPARSTVFSLLVWETQMTWSVQVRVKSSTLFMWMAEGSAKPKSEWSVKSTLRPMVPACMSASWQSTLKAWCPCTIVTPSRIQMLRRMGKEDMSVGSDTRPEEKTSGMGCSGR